MNRAAACLMALFSSVTPLLASAADERPSLAVLGLEHKGGIPSDAAELINEALVSEVRNRKAFSRVVTHKEVEAALGFEVKRQLLDCSTDGCAAEIASTLNVNYLLTGSVGRIGRSYLLNAKLVDVRTGVSKAAASVRAPGENEEVLLDRIPECIDELMAGAGLRAVAEAVGAEAAKVESAAPAGEQRATSTGPVNADAHPSSKGSTVRYVLLGVGAAVLGVGVVALLPALAGSGAAALMAWSFVGAGALAGSLRRFGDFNVRLAALGAGGAVAVLGMVLTLGGLTVGAALLGTSAFIGL